MDLKISLLNGAVPTWLRQYKKDWVHGDFIAGVIVTIMLIPQSLAYAMLAGLPPEVGLYASILPMVAYAIFGSSMCLAVGPVAVASLMTASALTPLAPVGSPQYVAMAIQLALLSGSFLILFGIFRLGAISHLLSHPVINGFILGSAILIAIGQAKHVLGVKVDSSDAIETLIQLWRVLPDTNLFSLIIGVSVIVVLVFAQKQIPDLLCKVGIGRKHANLFAKLTPMITVIVSTVAVSMYGLHDQYGVSVVGHVPNGIPELGINIPDLNIFKQLWLPALLIAIIGFVESVSMAQSLAMRRNQKVNADKELLGLGAANVASAFSGGMAVTGGFSRSVVNFNAGANTPMAGIIAAVFMAIVLFGFTEYFANLPQATLAATIIVAVLSLVDLSVLKEAWRYDRSDVIAILATAIGVMALGVEEGVLIGVLFSILNYIWRSGHPHIAVVGRVPGTEHFRNVKRHSVESTPGILVIRIDENLFFGNVHAIEEDIYQMTDNRSEISDVILMLSAVNRIDATALKILSDINNKFKSTGKNLHITEVKGPVMDRLANTDFLNELTGGFFLSTNEALKAISRIDLEDSMNATEATNTYH
jgi:sulfate permease, SulP family